MRGEDEERDPVTNAGFADCETELHDTRLFLFHLAVLAATPYSCIGDMLVESSASVQGWSFKCSALRQPFR